VLKKGKPIWAAMADLEMVFKVFTRSIDPDVDAIREATGLREGQVTLADRERLPVAA
jgi:hypothetical protein